jgi:hypothetical protein
MSKYEVRVIGGKSPKRGDGPVRRLRRRIGAAIRAALIRPGMIVLAGIAAFVLLVGTPHVAWDYQCRHPMQGYGTCRAVSWCAYYGIGRNAGISNALHAGDGIAGGLEQAGPRGPVMTEYFYTIDLGPLYGPKLERLADYISQDDREAFAAMLLTHAIDEMEMWMNAELRSLSAKIDALAKRGGLPSTNAPPSREDRRNEGDLDDGIPF